jgi:signal transduction histidine kinase
MRREAAAISASEPDRRLPVGDKPDELARLGSTLNAMLDRLQESMERERAFLDRASHELRTPLTVLRMELDLALSRARSPEELRAALENASAETDRLVRLAEDLLVLSRARDGRLRLDRRETDVAELVRRVGAANAARASSAGIDLAVAADGPVLAGVDPDRIRQALDDLLDNAFRHGAAGGGGVIRIGVERDGGGMAVWVEDGGPGFPAEVLRADPDGAGLGLSVARAIAEAAGGRLVLENLDGRGARASLVLPAVASPDQAAQTRRA